MTSPLTYHRPTARYRRKNRSDYRSKVSLPLLSASVERRLQNHHRRLLVDHRTVLASADARIEQLMMCGHCRQTLIHQFNGGNRVTEYDSSSTAACSRFSRLTDQRLAFLALFPSSPFSSNGRPNHHMVHRLVPNDVDDFIQRAERIPIHLNIAYGMCEGELGIGQRKSDPSITQIDTKPNHAWRISPSEPGRPMPQVPRRSWWRPRRHPVRSPACRRHHRQEPWKRHGPDHQP